MQQGLMVEPASRALKPGADWVLPRPPRPRPQPVPRPQWRTLLQLRRNALASWGEPAYRERVIAGPFLGRLSLLLNEPAAIRRLLVDDAEAYGRTATTLRILHPMIGDGLFLAEGDAWRWQRRTVAPVFAPRQLGLLTAIAARRTASALDRLARERRSVVDLLGFFQNLALEIAGEALFSLSLEPHARRLREHVQRYGERLARPSPLDLLLPSGWTTPAELLRRRFARSWFALLQEIVDERRERGIHEPPRDLFDALVLARDPETGRGFSPRELLDQIATFILAGHETTALALFWSAYLLALAPELQEAAAAEALARDLSVEAPSPASAPLLRAVVHEALRLYPPAFAIVREAKRPVEIAGQRLAPGDIVVVAPWVLHRHLGLWEEPDRFDPRRFLPGAPPIDRFAYLPFGAGPRVCIGAQFALVEAVTVLAVLLARHRLAFAGPRRVLPVAVVTTHPDRPVPFRLLPR
ncbi:MAG: cytochrome P450 [Geminicoccaceae bacterium]|nr:cytochrome P450 [Geminicoccaceae bacterium]